MCLFLSDIGRKRRRLPADGFYGAGDGSGAGDGVSRVTSCDDDLKLNRYTLLVDVVTEQTERLDFCIKLLQNISCTKI